MWRSTVLQVGLNATAGAAATAAASAAGAHVVRRAGWADPNPVAVALGTAAVVITVAAVGSQLTKKEET